MSSPLITMATEATLTTPSSYYCDSQYQAPLVATTYSYSFHNFCFRS